MSFWNIFKRSGSKPVKHQVSIKDILSDLVENGYQYDYEVLKSHYELYQSLNSRQRCAMLMTIHSFYVSFFLKDALVADFIKLKSEIMQESMINVTESFASGEELLDPLSSIKSKQVLDILLYDMKFLFNLLVQQNLMRSDGVEINKDAVNFLYGIFIPLGYSKENVHNLRQFIHVNNGLGKKLWNETSNQVKKVKEEKQEKGHDENYNPFENEEWVEKNFGSTYQELEEFGKPKMLKAETEACPFCGYKLRPVFWGEITPDILRQEKERKIFIGEDLYGKTNGVQPDFACGNCGESFFLGNKG